MVLRSKDAAERARLRRHLGLYGALWFLGLSVVVEDALVFLLPDPIFIDGRARTLPSATSPRTR